MGQPSTATSVTSHGNPVELVAQTPVPEVAESESMSILSEWDIVEEDNEPEQEVLEQMDGLEMPPHLDNHIGEYYWTTEERTVKRFLDLARRAQLRKNQRFRAVISRVGVRAAQDVFQLLD